MRLRHIEVFYAVYRCGSISVAARDLNVSQPSVSKVLKHAEDQLGYLLFNRSKGRLIPTPAAHELFQHVDEVYSQVRSLNQTARNIAKRKGGHIRLGTLPSLGLSAVPEAIARFRLAHPDVSFEVDTLHSHDVSRILFERGCDLAIGYGNPPGLGLVTEPLGTGELLLVARPDRFRTDADHVDLSLLHDMDFIGMRDSGPAGDLLMNAITERNIELREVVTARTYYMAVSLAALGLGVAVSDIFTAQFFKHMGVTSYRLDPPIRYAINAVALEGQLQSGLIRDFLHTLRGVLAAVDPDIGAQARL